MSNAMMRYGGQFPRPDPQPLQVSMYAALDPPGWWPDASPPQSVPSTQPIFLPPNTAAAFADSGKAKALGSLMKRLLQMGADKPEPYREAIRDVCAAIAEELVR
jgi:hypothetical protein